MKAFLKHFQKTILSILITFSVVGCDSPSKLDEVGIGKYLTGGLASNISMSGLVVDAYIKDAVVFVDVNENGQKDTDEPSAITDQDGFFSFNPRTQTNYCGINPTENCLQVTDEHKGKLVRSIGGVDIITNQPFMGQMFVRISDDAENSDVTGIAISPLTSVAAFMDGDQKQQLFDVLNLPQDADINQVDPLNFDTSEESDTDQKQRLQVLTKIQNTVQAISAGLAGDDENSIAKVNEVAFEALAAKIEVFDDDIKRKQVLASENKSLSIDTVLDETLTKLVEKADTLALSDEVKQKASTLAEAQATSDSISRNALLDNIVTLDSTTETLFERTAVSDTKTAENLLFSTELVGEQVNQNPLTEKVADSVIGIAESNHLFNALSDTENGVSFDLLNKITNSEIINSIEQVDALITSAQYANEEDPAVNLPPIVVNQNWLIQQNTSQTLALSASDPEGESLNYQITTPPVNGQATLVGDELRFEPTQDFSGVDTLIYEVSDGSNQVSAKVDIYVNASPTLTGANFNVTAGQVFSNRVAGLDSEQDPLVYRVFTPPLKGEVILDAQTGNFQYLPNADASGTDGFSVKAYDGVSFSEPAQIDFDITQVERDENVAPVMAPQTLEVEIGSTFVTQLTATDANDDALIYFVETTPEVGELKLSTSGGLVYLVPGNVAEQTLPLEIKVSDGAASIVTVVTLNLVNPTEPNTRPVAEDDSFSVDTSLSGQVVARDAEGNVLIYKLLDTVADGVLEFSHDGSFLYRANVGFDGTDSFTFEVSDGQASDQGTIEFVVINGNTPPEATAIPAGQLSVLNTETLSGQLVASDAETSDLVYQLVTEAVGEVALNTSTGAFVYTPPTDYVGSDRFEFVVSDGIVSSNVASVVINVLGPNSIDPELLSEVVDDQVLTGQARTLQIDFDTLLENDIPARNQSLTVIGFEQVVNGLVEQQTTHFLFTPNDGVLGEASFVYKVVDALSNPYQATVTVTVVENPNPVNDVANTIEDQVFISEVSLLENDLTPSGAAISAVANDYATNQGGSLTVTADGHYRYTPALNFFGEDQVSYLVRDTNGLETSASLILQVAGVNDAPVANDDVFTTEEDVAISIPFSVLTSNDIDIDSASFSVISDVTLSVDNASIEPTENGWFLTPAQDFAGEIRFDYSIQDTEGLEGSAEVFVDVTPVNDPPSVVDDSFTTDEDTPIDILFSVVLENDNDIDSATISVKAGEEPEVTNGTVEVLENGWRFTPTADFSGEAQMRYHVVDSEGAEAEAVVNITVNSLNDPPNVQADTFETNENTQISILFADVLANDSDSDSESFFVNTDQASTVTNGSLQVLSDRWLFEPTANFSGEASLRYVVQDSDGAEVAAEATINVLEVNDPPEFIETPTLVVLETNANLVKSIQAKDGVLVGEASVVSPSKVLNTQGQKDFVAVLSQTENLVTFIDFRNGDILKTYSITQPRGGVISADGNLLFIHGGEDENSQTITRVDISNLDTISQSILVSETGSRIYNLEISPDQTTLIASYSTENQVGQVVMMDAVDGANQVSITLGDTLHEVRMSGNESNLLYVQEKQDQATGQNEGASDGVTDLYVIDLSTQAVVAVHSLDDSVGHWAIEPLAQGRGAYIANGALLNELTFLTRTEGENSDVPNAPNIAQETLPNSAEAVDIALSPQEGYLALPVKGIEPRVLVKDLVNDQWIQHTYGTTGSANHDSVDQLTFVSPSKVLVKESTLEVITLSAFDPEGEDISYQISGGADASRLSIDALGNLTFNTAPDFENLDDANGDGVYEIIVTLSDGTNETQKILLIEVEDVVEIAISSVQFNSSSGLSDTYRTGDVLEIAVTFTGAVDVDTNSGTPSLLVSIDKTTGMSTREAVYDVGSGSAQLNFQYTIQSDDLDRDGFAIPANAILLNGGVISVSGTNSAVSLDHAAVATDATQTAYYRVALSEIEAGRYQDGYAIQASTDSGEFGFEVQLIEGNNEDGFASLLASSVGANQVTLIEGQSLFTPLSADQGVILTGETVVTRLGTSLASVGDMNLDGVNDFMVGTPFNSIGDANSGFGYLVSGLWNQSTTTDGLGEVLLLNQYIGESGGDSAFNAQALVAIGDENGDGIEDVLVGAHKVNSTSNSASGTGKAYVLPGSTNYSGFNSLGDDEIKIFANSSGGVEDNYGDHVAKIGDIDQDGNSDFLISMPLYDFASTDNGRVLLIFGGEAGFDLGFPRRGLEFYSFYGKASGDAVGQVAGIGDVNGDGIPDFAIASSKQDSSINEQDLEETVNNVGRIYVIFGQASYPEFEIDLAEIGNSIDGFVISHDLAEAELGLEISAAGDVNADGLDDLIIASESANSHQGQLFVVYGKSDTNSITTRSLSENRNGFEIINQGLGAARFGASTASGDINGDGISDLVMGVPGLDQAVLEIAGDQTSVINVLDKVWIDGEEQQQRVVETNGSSELVTSRVVQISYHQETDVTTLVLTLESGSFLEQETNLSHESGTFSNYQVVSETYDVGKAYTLYGGHPQISQVTLAGNENANTLSDTSGDDRIVAGRGADVVTLSAGTDVVYLGAGDDQVIMGSNTNLNASGARIDGGQGTDELVLCSGCDVDFTALSLEHVRNIEMIGLQNAASLNLNARVVNHLANANQWTTDRKKELLIRGDASNTLKLDSAEWSDQSESFSLDGQEYAKWRHQTKHLQLLVDEDVTVQIIAGSVTLSSIETSSSASINDVYQIGDTISFTVTFDGEVSVTGTPKLTLELDSGTAFASYVSQTGNSLTFEYEVVLGDLDRNGIAVSENPIVTEDGTISSVDTTLLMNLNYATQTFDAAKTYLSFNTSLLGEYGYEIINKGNANNGTDTNLANVRIGDDYNNDGYLDLFVVDQYAQGNIGGVFLLDGQSANSTVTLGLNDDNTSMFNGELINYGTPGDVLLGEFIEVIEDRDFDGKKDVVIGSSYGDNPRAKAYIVGSQTKTALTTMIAESPSTETFRSFQEIEVGDQNGDGFSDFLIGAQRVVDSPFGRGFLLDTALIDPDISTIQYETEADKMITNTDTSNKFVGYTSAKLGDLDRDGFDDYAVVSAGQSTEGRVHLIYGGQATFDLASDGIRKHTFIGESAGDFARLLRNVGDVNGDGRADFAVLAEGFNSGESKVYVVFGQSDYIESALQQVGTDSLKGFEIKNTNPIDSQHAFDNLVGGGDVNGDGLDDIVIAMSGADKVFVVFGKTNMTTVEISDVSQNNGGFIIQGEESGMAIGSSLDMDDVNGDGLADVVMTAPDITDDTSVFGKAFVVFGGHAQFTQTMIKGTTASETISGTISHDRIVAGTGDDTIRGEGGVDVIYAGSGEDVIYLTEGNVLNLMTDGSRVDGGLGTDTLSLCATCTLDLTQVGLEKIRHIEKIELVSGSRLIVSPHYVHRLGVMQNAAGFGKGKVFKIAATEAGSEVVIAGDTWVEQDDGVIEDGIGYRIYVNQDRAQFLYIDSRTNVSKIGFKKNASFEILENFFDEFNLEDTIESTVTYSFSIGSERDEAFFNLNSNSLGFIESPNYDDPLDANADNYYEVMVTATTTDGIAVSTVINIRVRDDNLQDE